MIWPWIVAALWAVGWIFTCLIEIPAELKFRRISIAEVVVFALFLLAGWVFVLLSKKVGGYKL